MVLKGERQPFYKSMFFNGQGDLRYSMIAAADVNGFVSEACEVIPTTGSGIDVGPIDRERFERWIQNKLLPVLGNFTLGEPRSLLVLDNATIHHSEKISSFIRFKGLYSVILLTSRGLSLRMKNGVSEFML